ncbi:MAG TPA: ABC transporter ATP-binding protein [Jatrophihabitans sp.]|jgi:peptide/nickel transport system ATP-binding protein|nr:ABC transporter ATP-binding protein [Jatrophihabitans sp.]
MSAASMTDPAEPTGTAEAAADPLVSVRNLKTHFFGHEGTTRAVDGVSFDIYAGRTLGIVGETGCGKSVTARSILRIVDRPGKLVDGEILLRRNGSYVDLAKLPVESRALREVRGGEIGLVFQEPMTSFSPVHTIGDQIFEAIRIHGQRTKEQVRERAIELLEMVRIPDPERRLDAYPWQLSGGLLQRAMIAMALAGDPRLLILDEPTTALDVITQAQILDLVRDLQDNTGLAMILITHDLGVIAQMADDVAIMYLGRVVERGPVEEIFAHPKHPYTHALLQSIPSRHETARQRLSTIYGAVPHPFNRPAGCSFHTRCMFAMPGVCNESEPEPRFLVSGHEVACHLDDSLLGRSANGAGHPVPAVAELRHASAADDGATAEPVLVVRDLAKEYALQGRRLGKSRGTVQAVEDVSFDLRPGETLALVGESGSGKTTVSRCILRAVQPRAGQIRYRTAAGKELDLARLSKKALRPLRREIQMVFQDPYSSLNPRMSIFDIISEPLLLDGMKNRNERIDRVGELLKLVGLRPEYLHRYPHAFSGGQRQRIGIARALALNPRLVVADEPVSALDVSVQAQILNLLMELQDQLGLTYLFVSHDLSVVSHISDRICVMYAGQVVEVGDTEQILQAPKHPYTAALLAAIPKPDPATRARFNIPRQAGLLPGDTHAGCYFQRRCPYAVERCKTERPELDTHAPGHLARCHRAAELSLGDD